MRSTVIVICLVLSGAAPAFAQGTSRFEIGPVLRASKVFIEAGATGVTTVAGVAAAVWFTRPHGVEVELTHTSNPISRSYQGTFISYPPTPSTSREEFERYAPIARRTLGYDPGIGWAVAYVARGAATPRVTVTGRVGLSACRYIETSDMTVLSIPEGVDPERVARDFRDESSRKTRGGLLLGFDVAVALTSKLSLAPEIRFVYGGPAQVGNKHRELAIGARATWRF